MSAGPISLTSALKVCRFNTADAPRLQSDRFLNPDQATCILWNGVDTTGRKVCADSFYTKAPGCNYATDRIVVENSLRPQYSAYITLDAAGIAGDIYGNNMNYTDSMSASKALDNVYNYTGSTGVPYRSTIQPSCGVYPYRQAMSQEAQQSRQMQAMNNGYRSCSYRGVAGV